MLYFLKPLHSVCPKGYLNLNYDILKSEDVELTKELRKELLEFAVGRVHLKGVFNQ